MTARPPSGLSRRRLLRLAGLAGAGALIAGCQRGTILPEPPPATGAGRRRTPPATGAAGVVPAERPPLARDFGFDTDIRLVPNGDFYTMKFHPSAPPEIDPPSFRLEVGGLVGRPLALSLAELRALPSALFMRTLECISNPAGGDLIGNAVWQGARLADVLALAGVDPRATDLKLESADRYHTGIPLSLALDPRSYLVYEMNGQPLPAKHGFPLRCLFPGRYGQKQPKWLTRITLQDRPHRGHWEAQGWSQEAPIRISSRFDTPGHRATVAPPLVVRGIAFSDLSGVSRVQVIVDDQAIHEARLVKAPAPFEDLAWTEWEWLWEQPAPGHHTLLAKAADGNDRTQSRSRPNLLAGTFPDGTTAMDRLSVTVSG
jgi:DMSO/TMAO reductase YedYZ molybdopterin-dependent catalytic subunit